ncbi:MAG TPA: twin-arginine translocase TatA/TatE family subunit [Rhodospirillaceae bacterium]|nr:twin-arginine translocase TatA/TatE family subunit [Rhodospirillaceae bacterium]
MGSFSIWHWLVVLAIVLILFGGGRVSNLMGELAKGVKAFKKGLQDDDLPGTPDVPHPKVLSSESAAKAPAGQAADRDEAAKH